MFALGIISPNFFVSVMIFCLQHGDPLGTPLHKLNSGMHFALEEI